MPQYPLIQKHRKMIVIVYVADAPDAVSRESDVTAKPVECRTIQWHVQRRNTVESENEEK